MSANDALYRGDSTSKEADKLLDHFQELLRSHDIHLPPHFRWLIFDTLSTVLRANPHGILAASTSSFPLKSLLTTSIPLAVHSGTGLSIQQVLASAIESAEHEVLFVTCFWAESDSLKALSSALSTLAGRHATSPYKPRVRLCFSSSGVLQKLLHTSSPRGKTYPPSSYGSLGLPSSFSLSHLDMHVKSLFYTPFSVLHGKFMILDRKYLFLPSANVSWEVWGEALSVYEGGIVDTFLAFWRAIWDPAAPRDLLPLPANPPAAVWEPARTHVFAIPKHTVLPTLFLPQPHFRNPRFGKSAPVTMQNTFLLHVVEAAQRSVYIQTPNLTSKPLIRALLSAAERGVAVEIVTCRRMMLLEQLVTTCFTAITETCVWKLKRRKKMEGTRLWIYYYTGEGEGEHAMAKAVKCHVKATIVDEEITVLGSANADRASWYTSQEVNVAVFDREYARLVRKELVGGLGGRLECVDGVVDEGGLGVGVEARRGAADV